MPRWIGILCWCFMAAQAQAWDKAGQFQWPVDRTQYWPACGRSGYLLPTQTHLQYGGHVADSLHVGEDWNGVCGDSTDITGRLYPVADGVIQLIDNRSGADSGKFGKMIAVRYTLPGGTRVDCYYMHLSSITSSLRVGDTVSPNQLIAIIGDGNGSYPRNAHLHWEARLDTSLDARTNPYYGGVLSNGTPREPATPRNLLRYTSPSLLVDDRLERQIVTLSVGNRIPFTVSRHAPSYTAYVEDILTRNRYSIRQAVQSGLVEQYGVIWRGDDGRLYYNSNFESLFFYPGRTYYLKLLRSQAALHILLPGDHYRADRARQDMICTASRDSNFTEVMTNRYYEDLGWDPNWQLRYMMFKTRYSQHWIYHITNKQNPLLRYTAYNDTTNGQWRDWQWVDWNRLY